MNALEKHAAKKLLTEKLAAIGLLNAAIRGGGKRLFRAKTLSAPLFKEMAKNRMMAYLPRMRVNPGASLREIRQVRAAMGVKNPRSVSNLRSIPKPPATASPLETGAAVRGTASRLGSAGSKGINQRASRRTLSEIIKNPSPSRRATSREIADVNKVLKAESDRIIQTPGGGVAAVRNAGPRGKRVTEVLKGDGKAQELFNKATVRHEMAERAASLAGKGKTPRFFSHIGPTPVLNDMNVAARLSGPGSEKARKAIRMMRAPELNQLGTVIYPRANMAKLDPRRLIFRRSARQQQANYDRLVNLGSQGNRMNRHDIRKVVNLYNDAARRNTYAFRRASRSQMNRSNLSYMKEDWRNLPRSYRTAMTAAPVLGGGGYVAHRLDKSRRG